MNDSVIRTYKSILLFTNTQIINSSNGTFCIKTLETRNNRGKKGKDTKQNTNPYRIM